MNDHDEQPGRDLSDTQPVTGAEPLGNDPAARVGPARPAAPAPRSGLGRQSAPRDPPDARRTNPGTPAPR